MANCRFDSGSINRFVERDAHCPSLKLEGLMHRYVELMSDVSTKQWSFLNLLENALVHEREMRQFDHGNVGTHGGVPSHQDAG